MYMKQNIFKIFAAVVLASVVFSACNKSEYAKINTNPASISEGNPSYLFTQGYLEFEPSSYLYWYYISKIVKNFDQVNGGSTSDTYNTMGELGGIGSQWIAVKKYENDIKDIVSRYPEEDQPKYQHMTAILNVLANYLAVLDTDLYGSMPFSEAAQARYGGTLTPKYDTQEEIFDTILKELDDDIDAFKNATDQINPGSQDPMYGGNVSKWIKVANGVKLKVAVRLLHQNKSKALQIAQEVAASDANIMTTADDFFFNRGMSSDNGMGDYAFHFGNGVEGMGTANKTIVDFMKKNMDPRVFIIYAKNSFNSEVVQAFFDAQANGETPEIPDYIMEDVIYSVDADGHKHFESWAEPGEPWVRIQGVPRGINISQLPEYLSGNNYFDSDKWKVKLNDSDKTYSPYSSQTERLVRGRCGSFTFPTVPGRTLQLADNVGYNAGIPWYGMGITAGEMNLYLAELSLAGASLPKSAAQYFEAGVRASAAEYNTYATLNQIPYIDALHTSDIEDDATIAITDAMIDEMMSHSDYQLTGNHSDDLEKVYIQQYLHFMYQPTEQFVTARRGGIPKIGSAYIPWNSSYDPTIIPRRLYQTQPNETDIMREAKIAAFQEQGFSFTTGDAGAKLNTERVWYDKNAPQWGAGPNL
ncbi:MAG: SusD/RagB family nutrient-binding outer membrane lipoprotein [Bacteroidales bacterium]|nr:SusD/RagB family nutrient-binding outer membrane lipoprotein [Bacteroidales bacterium]